MSGRGYTTDGLSSLDIGVNVARFTSDATPTMADKINAAVASLNGAIGAVVIPAGMPAGEGNTVTDNAILIDFRGTAQSQGLRFNLPASLGPQALRSKMFLQDNYNAAAIGLAPGKASCSFYVLSYVDNPEATNSTIAAFNATMAINTGLATFSGVLVGIEGEAFANANMAAPIAVQDVRGGTFNALAGGNTSVTNLYSLVAQTPVNIGTGLVSNAIALMVESGGTAGLSLNLSILAKGMCKFDGVSGFGSTPLPNAGVLVRNAGLTGNSQFGLQSAAITSAAATVLGTGVTARCDTAAAAYTQGISAAFHAQNAGKGAGSTIGLLTGLYIENQTAGNLNFGFYSLHTGSHYMAGFFEGSEIADPAAPAANNARLYFRDNGSGKTQVVARFASGAVQVMATEP